MQSKCISISALAAIVLSVAPNFIEVAPASAADCNGATLGTGRVAQVIDGRTLRLSDGREVRLTGIAPLADSIAATTALTALVGHRDIVLQGDNDTPDRYGRQHAFVTLPGDNISVQSKLLRTGAALLTGTIVTGDCTAELAVAEDSARRAGLGLWAAPGTIKNAEKPDDILAELGRFTLVEGTVVSARQSGATFYLNFGRRWTRDFAVIIRKEMVGLLSRDGIDTKALAGRRVRVRGWIERRGGPRIEVRGTGQIAVLDHS
jgi:endonuclease YncB( thermonuclease family)